MHARVTTLRSAPEDTDEGITFVKEQILPGVDEIPGTCGWVILTDRSAGRATAVVFYDSAVALDDSRDEARHLRDLVYQRLNLTHAPHVAEFEVTAAKLPIDLPALV